MFASLVPKREAPLVRRSHRALELGVNWIDTAGGYGMRHSEEVVAAAVKSWSERRSVTQQLKTNYEQLSQ